MKRLINTSALALVASLTLAPAFAQENVANVVVASDVNWGFLNPLRGDKSPGAADLWGDRTTDTATGMLVKFKKGFESPPHIHNITYRGIVIEGQMHNDDPEAEKMWMPTGSFWTQPAGENHTTAANGQNNLIYLEIDSGPYLVKPTDAQFDNGERPLNMHADNIVWLDSSELSNITAAGVESTFVWESPLNMTGSMIKLPVGFNGEIITHASEFRAVVISGDVNYTSNEQSTALTLRPASFIESTGKFTHHIQNNGNASATLYIRTNEEYQVN